MTEGIDRERAEEIIGAILDWQEEFPTGSELFPLGPDADIDAVTDPDVREAALNRRASILTNRDEWNDSREEALQRLLAQVKATLGVSGHGQDAVQRFREQIKVESETLKLRLLSIQDQGPSPLS